MHRTDGAGHVGNRFVAEDLEANRPPTEITAAWMNDIQENIAKAIEAAGLVLVKNDHDQLSLAIGFLSGRVVDTIAALRALSSESCRRAFVTGYYAAGDGGGGDYWLDSTDTASADNGGSIIVATDGGRWKLAGNGPFSILQFGARPGGTSNCYQNIINAVSTGKTVTIPDGDFLVDLSNGRLIELVAGQTVRGNGVASKLVLKHDGVGSDGVCFVLNSNCAVEYVNFDVANTNAAVVDTTNNPDPQKNFNYNNKLIAISSNPYQDNLRVHCCHIAHTKRGVSFGINTNVTVTNNYIYQVGEWGTQFYIVHQLIFDSNIVVFGGTGGLVAASSVKKATFSNNVCIGSGTGINPGGSDDPNYNVEEISITGNWVMARDCINCENGVYGATVTGNICHVLYDTALGYANGVGVAFTSDSSSTSAGIVGNVTAVGNTIVADTEFPAAAGILVGCLSASSFDINGIVISNNIIDTKGNAGIELRLADTSHAINDAVITGNRIVAARGVLLNNCHKARVAENDCKTPASTIIGNYYGIYANGPLRYSTIERNSLIGYGYSIKIGDVTDVILDDNRTLPIPAGIGAAVSSDPSYPSWFMRGVDSVITQSTTASYLSINSTTTVYSPPSSVVIPGFYSGFIPNGERLTVYFTNGNTTIQHGNNIYLKGGATTNPGPGCVLEMVKIGSVLHEVSRND